MWVEDDGEKQLEILKAICLASLVQSFRVEVIKWISDFVIEEINIFCSFSLARSIMCGEKTFWRFIKNVIGKNGNFLNIKFLSIGPNQYLSQNQRVFLGSF